VSVAATPAAPAPVAPSGTLANRTPTYSWWAASGATQYYLQIVNRATNVAVYQSWITSSAAACSTNCSFRPAVTLAVGNYSWRVIAGNAAGNTSSTNLYFTVQ